MVEEIRLGQVAQFRFVWPPTSGMEKGGWRLVSFGIREEIRQGHDEARILMEGAAGGGGVA